MLPAAFDTVVSIMTSCVSKVDCYVRLHGVTGGLLRGAQCLQGLVPEDA